MLCNAVMCYAVPRVFEYSGTLWCWDMRRHAVRCRAVQCCAVGLRLQWDSLEQGHNVPCCVLLRHALWEICAAPRCAMLCHAHALRIQRDVVERGHDVADIIVRVHVKEHAGPCCAVPCHAGAVLECIRMLTNILRHALQDTAGHCGAGA